jgi:iron(III) transport system ATP-binding protein
MIAGFEEPTGGDIYFGERRMNQVAPNARDATMVFQSYAIFPHLNVYDNIAFGLRLKGMARAEMRARVDRVVEQVGLTGMTQRPPSQLSGGQQQRVALARCLVMEPRMLLFDEPLSNLDAKLREQMRIEIRELQQRLGITSVYVTHDQVEAMSISDVVVVMDKGRVAQVGARSRCTPGPSTASWPTSSARRTSSRPPPSARTRSRWRARASRCRTACRTRPARGSRP